MNDYMQGVQALGCIIATVCLLMFLVWALMVFAVHTEIILDSVNCTREIK